MNLVNAVKEILVPDTERGVEYECVECGGREIMEVEGFGMRPDG